ncbi:hypothetical protein FOPE_02029 [Fonsecaea pedrosoi]|nr:hypothetical protein FOPE_02029 [Fonsecaea pedrosoi]
MSDIFRPLFRSVEDKVANRREQLRKAQRTFRERRDQYLRVLEKSVRRLQANEARLQAEVDRLERDLAAANSKLAQCEAELHKSASLTHTEHAYANRGGYATGLGGFNFASEMGNSARPAYLSSPNGWMESGAGASVSSSSSSTLVWIETENGQPVQMHVQQKQEFGFLPPSAGKNSASLGRDRSATTVLVAHLDAVVVAMEFVLKLESPCLPHLRQNEDEDNGDTTSSSPLHGHVHTASAALLCCYPSPSSSSPASSSFLSPPKSTSYTNINKYASPLSPPNSTPSPSSSTALTWPAPKATLERLLNISDDLPIDQASELTPIQVWHCVQQSPGFSSLMVQGLNQMAERLVAHVKCYGFGAVVRRDFLTKLLSEM